MKLINEKLILAYGLTDTEQEKLNSLLSKQDILPCKIIQKNMAEQTIKEVLCSIEVVESESKTELPLEKILLFNNYKDKELYDLIDSIRKIKSVDTILAAVTPTSINWTVSYLLQHLLEEREAHRKR